MWSIYAKKENPGVNNIFTQLCITHQVTDVSHK